MNKHHILLAAVLVAAPAWAEDQSKPEQSQAQTSQSDRSDSAQTAGAKQAAATVSENDARQVLSKTVASALSKGQIQNLNQQFAQADQERLGDLSKEEQQLDQSIDQLKQAYKDKFQQDLDLSRSAEQIFTAQFFQIGGGLADEARQASARQAPDNATDADPTAGIADDAQPTASKISSERTLITIPEDKGMPATKVAVIKEGGQWKIDLPDTLDGKQFTQNLQKHVNEAVQQKDQWVDAVTAQRTIAHHVLMAFADSGGQESKQ